MYMTKFNRPTIHALDNIESGRIYCQHYSAYNDPFEFWSHVYEGVPDAETEPERFAAAKKAWGCEWMSPDDETLVEYFDECKDYQPPFRELRETVRLACFGTERDNLLMWSHYGDALRGFCIVFDEQKIIGTNDDLRIVEVAYLESPPVADAFVYAIAHDQIWFHEMATGDSETLSSYRKDKSADFQDYRSALEEAYGLSDEVLQFIFAAKPSGWKYEKERRLLLPTIQYDDLPVFQGYPRDAITEVILGERMPTDYRAELLSKLKRYYPSVPIKTARRVYNTYTLAID